MPVRVRGFAVLGEKQVRLGTFGHHKHGTFPELLSSSVKTEGSGLCVE